MIGGGLFLMVASVQTFEIVKIVRREPKAVTAAELCRQDYVESAPGWLVYTFAEAKPIGQTVTRRRLGQGGEVQARCLLVRVEDHWLVTTVASGFEGNDLVGRLVPVDSPSSQTLIDRVRRQESDPAAVLPFEFNAVDGSLSDQQVRYMAAGWMGGFGLVGVLLGLHLFRGGRRPAPSSLEPAAINWAHQSVSKS